MANISTGCLLGNLTALTSPTLRLPLKVLAGPQAQWDEFEGLRLFNFDIKISHLIPSATVCTLKDSASAGSLTVAISSFSFLLISCSSISICFLLSTTWKKKPTLKFSFQPNSIIQNPLQREKQTISSQRTCIWSSSCLILCCILAAWSSYASWASAFCKVSFKIHF